MLPEHHGKSVTGVLTGSTMDHSLPVWTAVQDVIEQIKQEAISEGDTTTIDLDYFRKILLANQTDGYVSVKSHAGHHCGDVFYTADGKYSISKIEQERLNRIYHLLPNYHGRSITGVLSGSTMDQSLPVWTAVQDAITKIRQEAVRKGDKTTIDLNYFRKLHWSSMRVTGRGGHKEKDVFEDNKSKTLIDFEKVKKINDKTSPKKIKLFKKSKKK